MAKTKAYEIGQTDSFQISRAKLDNFIKCPRCFVLDRRHRIAPPSGPMFTLNSAVDGLLKKEFDVCRENQTVHPDLAQLGAAFVPLKDDRIEEWQNTRKGVTYHDVESNLILTGAIDDMWITPGSPQVHIIDYKTTSKAEPVTELGHEEYHDAYRRQLDIYNFLLGKNGLEMSTTGYWFYATAMKNYDDFEMKLNFVPSLIAYECQPDWIPESLLRVKAALENPVLVHPSPTCGTCNFVSSRIELGAM